MTKKLKSINFCCQVIASDNVGIPTEKITDLIIDADYCPGMVGRIKLFLIQVWRILFIN
jgi:hypothetical protein